MEKLKLIVGMILLPFAYVLWVLDRMMYTLMPHEEHKKLSVWLTNTTVIYSITRLLTLVAIRYLIKWIFGV